MNSEFPLPSAAAPVAAPLGNAKRSRHIVVEGATARGHDDPAEGRRAERRTSERRVQDAAIQAAAALLPAVGGAVLIAGLLVGGLATQRCAAPEAPPGMPAWAVAAAWLVAATAVMLARSLWAAISRSLWRVAAAAQLAALCLIALPALVCIQAAAVAAAIAGLLAVAGAVSLAVLPAAAAGFVLVPLLAGLVAANSVADGTAGAAAAVGAAGSLAALAAALQRCRQWRQATRALVDSLDRSQRLEQERDAALQTDHDKSRFLAIASHDLRQPVHALGLFAATLQRRLAESPDEPLARNLMRAVDGLERSFNAMLDVSKLDAGALVPRVETFALRDMFRRLHMQYAGQAEFAGLGLRFSPGGKSVSSDPELLERIVGNLIQNAIKYTDRGGIVVVARSAQRCINVEIWDTGSGIAPTELPRIFDEFYQVGRGERDRSHGLGMGLAIVKRLSALLGHRLEVASSPGRGTMFRICVPRGGLPGIQEDLGPADTQPMTLLTPQMVLVVDDEEPIREGLRLLLQEWGYHAMTASSAVQAEQAVAALEGRVDLILSDLHLGPGADGVDVIHNVRRLCGREVPAILITGDTAPEHIRHLSAGTDTVLFKPVQPRRLFEALRTALR